MVNAELLDNEQMRNEYATLDTSVLCALIYVDYSLIVVTIQGMII